MKKKTDMPLFSKKKSTKSPEPKMKRVNGTAYKMKLKQLLGVIFANYMPVKLTIQMKWMNIYKNINCPD